MMELRDYVIFVGKLFIHKDGFSIGEPIQR
jgi:hypothetical protein